jgi:hypothetical protein
MTMPTPSAAPIPRRRSALLIFAVFMLLFSAFAALVIWLVTEPFRNLAPKPASQPAPASAPAAPGG